VQQQAAEEQCVTCRHRDRNAGFRDERSAQGALPIVAAQTTVVRSGQYPETSVVGRTVVEGDPDGEIEWRIESAVAIVLMPGHVGAFRAGVGILDHELLVGEADVGTEQGNGVGDLWSMRHEIANEFGSVNELCVHAQAATSVEPNCLTSQDRNVARRQQLPHAYVSLASVAFTIDRPGRRRGAH